MRRYLDKENYVHDDWSLERRRGHLYAVLFEENRHHIEGRRILHLGCNNGSTTELIQDFGPAEVYGIDINREAVAAARSAGRQNVHLGNALAMPTWDEPWETIVAFDVIEHIYPDDMPQLVAECHRSLVQFGRILAFSPRMDPETPSRTSQDPTHVQFFIAADHFAAGWRHRFDVVWCGSETRANPSDGRPHDAWFMVLEAR